ncbi:MAG: response regulator [Lachnospiraceae bacterium]|nr:response regulator [Lachnospiraceae bacterium]
MAKKHILIVDDVTTNLRFIGELLKEEYSLSMARSGDQALKMLKKIDVDLILLDVKMPKMDGIDVMEQLSKDKDLGKIPVIFLSADGQEETQDKVYELGAADFIKKPFEPVDLLARIKKALSAAGEDK